MSAPLSPKQQIDKQIETLMEGAKEDIMTEMKTRMKNTHGFIIKSLDRQTYSIAYKYVDSIVQVRDMNLNPTLSQVISWQDLENGMGREKMSYYSGLGSRMVVIMSLTTDVAIPSRFLSTPLKMILDTGSPKSMLFVDNDEWATVCMLGDEVPLQGMGLERYPRTLNVTNLIVAGTEVRHVNEILIGNLTGLGYDGIVGLDILKYCTMMLRDGVVIIWVHNQEF